VIQFQANIERFHSIVEEKIATSMKATFLEGHADRYLSVKSLSLVASAPKNNTETKYRTVVVRVAASVPMGIERCVSLSDADLLEPAIIPVTAGKNRPTNALKEIKKKKMRKGIKKLISPLFQENALSCFKGMCF
jgi:Trm5-related predicted tRNA methylase